jgi:TetR/AcrR family fatty acid metabolism transcriptional regulator
MNEYSFIILQGECIFMKRNAEKYNRILEAACKVFAEFGFYQSTIALIAKEAGVADGTIYLYFKNKDDILVQFVEYKTKLVFERFREAVERADSAVEKLRNLIRTHLGEFQKDPNMAIVYQAQNRHMQNGLALESIKAMSKMYRDIVAEIIELGQEEGTIRRNLYIGLVKRLINGAVEEVINSWLHTGRGYDLESMADPLVELFTQGIGATSRETE